MRDIGINAERAILDHCRRRIAQRSARINNVIDHDAMPVFDVTNDVHHFRDAGFWAALVDDRQIGIKPTGQ